MNEGGYALPRHPVHLDQVNITRSHEMRAASNRMMRDSFECRQKDSESMHRQTVMPEREIGFV